jgi:hypothetical protein
MADAPAAKNRRTVWEISNEISAKRRERWNGTVLPRFFFITSGAAPQKRIASVILLNCQRESSDSPAVSCVSFIDFGVPPPVQNQATSAITESFPHITKPLPHITESFPHMTKRFPWFGK